MDACRLKDEHLWTQVTVKVSPPAVEAVGNLLFELGAEGLLTEEEGTDRLSLTAYLPSDCALPAKIQTIHQFFAALKEIGVNPGSGEVQTSPWRDRGEGTQWKAFFRPLLLGKSMVIKPSWEDCPPDWGEVIIEIDPGSAFGTGRHASTALCLRFLERWVRGGERVLDVGTGSGILSITAAKLGAGAVRALEIDAGAREVAQRNLRRNGLEGRVEVSDANPSSLPPLEFDIVVANLTLEEIHPLLPALAGVLAGGEGMLFLSGLLRSEIEAVRATCEKADLTPWEVELQGEWAGMGWRREA